MLTARDEADIAGLRLIAMLSVTLRPVQATAKQWRGSAMSLDPWERDSLDSIKNGLADSDPGLVARLGMFTRLAAGEAMPVRDKLQAVSRQAVQRGARRSTRLYRRLGVGRVMLLVWLITTLTLITAALASSRASGPGTCAGFWGSLCGHEATAAQPAQPVP
jgi:hypothetical protein